VIDAAPPPLARAPRNVLPFVSWPGAIPENFEMVTEGGAWVPFQVEAASEDPGQFWVRPADLLEAGTTYVLSEGDNSLTFIVDDVIDDTPPTHTRVQGQGARLHGRCPEHLAAEVRAVVEAEVDGQDRLLTLDEREPYGVVYSLAVRRLGDPSAPAARRFYVHGDRPYFGQVVSDDYRFQECFENYQEAEAAWDYQAEVVVFDQAGNQAIAEGNGRLTEFRFAFNVSDGYGCRVGARRGGGSVALALAVTLCGALVARRGRRGPAPRP
jgi:hypothetical protein